MSRGREVFRRPVERIRADVAADPYLPYLLLLALVTCGFGVWFRLPNFAAPDEYSRLIQPMKVAGEFVADPRFESVRAGITDGRALGATFYLYAVVLAPVFLVVLASGNLGEFATLGTIESRWDLWHAAPAWFWAGSVLLGRLVSVALGVGCVYLTYRLGVELRDRFAGRLAALLLALSLGFFSQAHMIGEDLPMLFLLLASVLLAGRYVESGRPVHFLLGCLTGGLAIAFKLSGGAAAVVLGVALLVRAGRSDDPLGELTRPRVVLGGLVVGALSVTVGIPSVLLGGPMELLTRAGGSIASKTGKSGGLDAPIWYWLLRQYVRGLGLPLFVATVAGAVATVGHLVERRGRVDPLYWLLLTAAAVFLFVYSGWEFVRLRHVVPTFPPLLVLFAAAASRWRESDRPRLRTGIRAALVVVVLSTALTAGVAEAGYVTEPRDQATRWIAANAASGETVTVYENSVADIATPHGRETSHFDYREQQATSNASLVSNESRYTEWMTDTPDREPAFVQLTANELAYVDPTDTDYHQYPERREYIEGLLNGEYGYEVVAEFGRWERTETLRDDFRQAVFTPEVEGQERYVVILAPEERVGPGETATRAGVRSAD
ncbi:ArnT family glycosyltransferase [Halosimplex salinum]|uniref:ArnT family glycosyltransferase n=1 Tax=Halosimplex salinum TaxID=1710538 RepID=UPI000F473901|nr:glycosyltransferase family 39 protein [Halosimplex salinum]